MAFAGMKIAGKCPPGMSSRPWAFTRSIRSRGKYQLGAPLFDKITLSTGPEKKFVITANKESDGHIYVQEVYLNEKKLDRTWITHEEIMNGGELKFVLSTRP